MFIRPQRYRIILAFLFGLALSIALLTGGYFYYKSQQNQMEADMRVTIEKETEVKFEQEHPTGLVYIFQNDKKAGEIIADIDLIPTEVSIVAIPEDVITSLSEAQGRVMRCDVRQNTMATKSLLFTKNDYPDDLRVMEYTVLNLPQKIELGSFLDIRIMFPNGLDYIILSKKQVIDLSCENKPS